MTRSSSPSRAGANDRKAVARAVRHAPQQVRIIGGDWKRTPLQVIDADGLRPTPDRVRETLFNWLGQQIDGANCLDLFAGTGALGFEAASRGARRVLMVERNSRASAQLKAIKAKLGAAAVEIAEADALRLGASLAPESFDLVFLDPPFDGALLPKALLVAARLATSDGVIYVESPLPLLAEAPHDLDDEQAAAASATQTPHDPALSAAYSELLAAGWRISRQGRAGAVHYHLLRREIDQ